MERQTTMAKERFIERTFKDDTLAVIDLANGIIRQYRDQGFTLTLRQLYYQFVARGLLQNRQQEYKRLGSIVNDGRLAGLIDWAAIEDRTRNVEKPNTWDDPSSVLSAVASQYKEDLWADQPSRPEVWIEKDALVGVIEPACERWRMSYLACRGYVSQSEAYSAGKRFEAMMRRDQQRPIVLHLGDHDPSGMDMTNDNTNRLAMFARQGVKVIRLALNWNQIEQYNPPPNPAKETDSRSGPYMLQYGESSWELDALEPTVIDRLIDDAVREIVDLERWNAAEADEGKRRDQLAELSARWDDVADWLEN
jgi:hypothetical protein